MGILLIDGFAHYDVAQIGRAWSLVDNPANILVGSAYGRGGGKSGVQIGSNSRIGGAVSVALTSPITIGFAFYMPALPASGSVVLCSVSGLDGSLNTVMLQNLRIDSNGYMSICFGSGSQAYTGSISSWYASTGIWHYAEWKVKLTNSTAEGDCGLIVDGFPYVVMPSGVDTLGAITSGYVSLGHGSGSGTSYSVMFTDLVVSDGGSYPGDRVVHTLMPIADGSKLDFVVTGAASAYAAVNETPPDLDSTYISASTSGNTQSFVMAAPTETLYGIYGVQIVALLDNASPSNPAIYPGVVSSGTFIAGPSAGSSSSYAYTSSNTAGAGAFGTNPITSASWVNGDFTSLEAGVKLA